MERCRTSQAKDLGANGFVICSNVGLHEPRDEAKRLGNWLDLLFFLKGL